MFFEGSERISMMKSDVTVRHQDSEDERLARASVSQSADDHASSACKSIAKKRRERRRCSRVKDENAPKGPRSAYVHFLSSRRGSFGRDHKDMKHGDINKALAAEWSALGEEEKRVFHDRAAAEREQYERAMEAYRQSESYKEFQKTKLRSKNRIMKRLRSDVLSSEIDTDDSDMEVTSTPHYGDVPIFSDEFLAHNRAQEFKMMKTRRSVARLKQSRDLLLKRNKMLENEVNALRARKARYEENSLKLLATKEKWSKTLEECLSGITLPGEISIGVVGVEAFMARLGELLDEDPTNVVLNEVRKALAHAEFY